MPGRPLVHRLSLTELYIEDRKQRAHLKKISDMQRHSSLDNVRPACFPQLHQNFVKHLTDKHQVINRENEIKSRKLLNIMGTKIIRPPPVFHPTNQARRRNKTSFLSRSNVEYSQRIAKTKAKYNTHEWRNHYEQHKEHLKLGKDNKLFTPYGVGVNRQRIVKANSLVGSKCTTPMSSLLNLFNKRNKN